MIRIRSAKFRRSTKHDTLQATTKYRGTCRNQTTPLNGTGPWTLTATNTTFSYLLFFPNENFTFAEMTNFNAVFEDIAGGAGGGAPRLRLP